MGDNGTVNLRNDGSKKLEIRKKELDGNGTVKKLNQFQFYSANTKQIIKFEY